MDQIIPGLWIGDLACALATDYLEMAGITHIVTAMKQRLPSPITLPDGRKIDDDHIYHVNIDDIESAPILVHFPGVIEFIDEALQQTWIEDGDGEEISAETQDEQKASNSRTNPPPGKKPGQWATMGEGTVLVHCHAGISRSVAIVLAYLMHMRKISVQDALNLVRSRRSIADPNSGFMHQLELYESADCSVDVRNQRIRRFLMSQASILRGDPIDDVLLSYYPSPLHSPANSFPGSTQQGSGSGGIGGMGLQFSKLDTSDSGSRKSSVGHAASDSDHQSPISSGRNSATMSRQNSRIAASTAAARGANERHRSEPHEVMITVNSGNLPGGVNKVRGNQARSESSRAQTNNSSSLPKPKFKAMKLRCKKCRRELAAQDHVVEHEAGMGKDAFDVRKREKDIEQKSRDNRATMEQSNTQDLTLEERFGATERPSGNDVTEEEETENAKPIPPAPSAFKSAASLSAQLPPHLAALRRGTPAAPQTNGNSIPSRPPPSATQSQASTPSNDFRKMLHSHLCSSYFVEPLAWMTMLRSGEVAGRLDCPTARCGAKLGSWDWAGMQCACGAWVTPAFALHRSKVDEV
ncbi:phosphatases II [Meira miltonrushii]|uniref:protein-tyrosine-phosphatase n=1 Tax=Meira miltonrushii TaxID=1280837 RepID=A0A316VMX4_9BASI|nr:phosphatases II [Meira miltonrushii]PWN37451.1 phosphatases II [Meira miltonrushii]